MSSKQAILFIAFVSCYMAAAAAEPGKPNFVVINIDDLGYADIGPFGSKLNRTPNLDRMAAEGRKLTCFYAAPVCSPSRAALMTGCYPKRALPIPHVLFPEDKHGLHPDEVTVAELLKQRGYATACIGKWHLGDQPEFLPTKQGFDVFYGLPYSNDMGPASDGVKSDLGAPLPKAGAGKGQPPLPLMRQDTVLQRVLPDDQTRLVELYTNEAIAFIKNNKDKSFFLYMPHSSVHFPIYPGKAFQKKSTNGYYGDWVEETDWSVGQILNTLRESGLAENTLVLFTSDNGGTARGLNTPLRGHKNSTFEGGIRVCTIAWWPGKIPAGTFTDAITGMFDILPTFARLAGADLPQGRKLDGMDIWPLLAGQQDAKGHDEFFYYRGLKLEAVRSGPWKLFLASEQLYNLESDISESQNVAESNPAIVERLKSLAASMKDDLGVDGPGPGCRRLGLNTNPLPLIDRDGKVRPGFEPK